MVDLRHRLLLTFVLMASLSIAALMAQAFIFVPDYA
jgi:hypothetical protein